MKKIISLVLFICFISFSESALSQQDDEMPMYGGKSFTPEEKIINEQFVQGITGVYGKEKFRRRYWWCQAESAWHFWEWCPKAKILTCLFTTGYRNQVRKYGAYT